MRARLRLEDSSRVAVPVPFCQELSLFLILQAKAEVAAGDHPTDTEMKGEPNNVPGNQSQVETEA